jgi:DNA-binding GntR family transcriptional regulator
MIQMAEKVIQMEKLGYRRNLELEVYDIIKSLIIDCKFMPGDKISIDQLRVDLGVSRTPIVIALKMLEKEMLTITKPRRGTMCAPSQKEKSSMSWS